MQMPDAEEEISWQSQSKRLIFNDIRKKETGKPGCYHSKEMGRGVIFRQVSTFWHIIRMLCQSAGYESEYGASGRKMYLIENKKHRWSNEIDYLRGAGPDVENGTFDAGSHNK